jgi:hypothetical protein
MRPISQADGYYLPWLVDESDPNPAAMVENVGVGLEDAV